MTELQALGITIGSAGSVAIADTVTGGDAVSGGLVLTHRSGLRVNRTGGIDFADAGQPRADDVVLEGFLSRVGDPVDILADDGSRHAAHDLVATAVACLIDEAAAATGNRPAAAVLCHPVWWSAHTVELQRAAFADAVTEVTLMPEPLAAARWLESAHGALADAAIVVLDLGATGTSATVVRTGSQSAVLATARTEDAAGDEFDLLTMRYVLANALGDRDIDPFDPATERRLALLRENCRAAKEILSGNTATTVRFPLDGSAARIRLVRNELEELLRGRLLTCLDLVRDVVHRAGLGPGDLDRVLLTGGGATIPLVTELISGEFGLPVVAAPQPAHTAARGAAVVAADLLAHTVPDTLAAADTAEIAVAATGTAAPVLPRTPRPRRLGSGQRAGVLAAAVAALALLATGTVAVGPGLPSEAATPASSEQTTVPPASGATAPVPPAAANVQDISGPGAGDTPAAGRPETPARSDSPAVQPGSPSATALPGAGLPAPGVPAGAQAPADTAVPAPQPAPSPGGGYTPPPAPSVDGLGDTVGDTLGGVVGGVGEGVGKVGEGVGELGEGIGDGVGGVLGGLGG
ncbi:Hsp70 family protein [Nocardia higoensis]|uniref:Hsp70 family protein n=1 Tax=Nocardia higoensis TaxID=228599 RepID=A0ABS0DDC4_9NOCA|nr:Hsp70 family protein [Nocardia higoensis]MBF6356445.1 Hsp70 family protein [Nocardia higoensis]